MSALVSDDRRAWDDGGCDGGVRMIVVVTSCLVDKNSKEFNLT